MWDAQDDLLNVGRSKCLSNKHLVKKEVVQS